MPKLDAEETRLVRWVLDDLHDDEQITVRAGFLRAALGIETTQGSNENG